MSLGGLVVFAVASTAVSICLQERTRFCEAARRNIQQTYNDLMYTVLVRSPRAAAALLQPFIGWRESEILIMRLRGLVHFLDDVEGWMTMEEFMIHYSATADTMRRVNDRVVILPKAVLRPQSLRDRFMQNDVPWEDRMRVQYLSLPALKEIDNNVFQEQVL